MKSGYIVSWRNACFCIRICSLYFLCSLFSVCCNSFCHVQDAAALQSFDYEGKINVVFQVAKDFTS